MLWPLGWAAIVAGFYDLNILAVKLPWLPVCIIGKSVAFYVGYKNNSAYDRMWEARKIWGAIINSRRTWGMYVDGFVNNLFAEKKQKKFVLRKQLQCGLSEKQRVVPTLN